MQDSIINFIIRKSANASTRKTHASDGEQKNTAPRYSVFVSNLRLNYPNWVTGPFDLGNGSFFSIRVLTTTHFIEDKLAREKQAKRSH